MRLPSGKSRILEEFAGICSHIYSLAGGFFVLLYYLPIYFQAVLGTSAEQSGIRILALIISQSKSIATLIAHDNKKANLVSCTALTTIVSGILISALGPFAPYMVVGSVLATVAAGLTYTLSVDSSTGEWIGYLIFIGIAVGLCFQAPVMAAQALAKDEDVPTTTALVMFLQTMGGALCLSSAQAAFGNELIKSLTKNVPGVDSRQMLAVGATDIKKVFRPAELPGIMNAYMDGLKVVFIFIIAMFGVTTIASVAMP